MRLAEDYALRLHSPAGSVRTEARCEVLPLVWSAPVERYLCLRLYYPPEEALYVCCCLAE